MTTEVPLTQQRVLAGVVLTRLGQAVLGSGAGQQLDAAAEGGDIRVEALHLIAGVVHLGGGREIIVIGHLTMVVVVPEHSGAHHPFKAMGYAPAGCPAGSG